MTAQLIIDGTSVQLSSAIPVSCNYAIANVREPDKRDSSMTKTVTIPGTQDVNQLFEHIFEVNIKLSSYNPNVKIPAIYYVNSLENFRGDLQLLRIKRKDDLIFYECNIIGVQGNLFLDLGDDKLEDLDFSAYDHTLNQTNIVNSWSNTSGLGYTYPLIDYGFNGQNAISFKTTHLKPAFSEYEYIKKIIEGKGYSYTSTVLTSSLVKRMLVPCVDEFLSLSPTQVNNAQFYAGRSSTQSFNHTISYVSSSWKTVPNQNDNALIFNDDSTVPFNDAGGNYNTATGVFTVGTAGYYTISTNLTMDLTVTPPTSTTSFSAQVGYSILTQRSTDGGATWSIYQSSPTTYTPTITGTTGAATVTVTQYLTCSSALFAAGDQFRIKVRTTTFWSVPTFTGANTATTGTFTLGVKVPSTFYCLLSPQVVEGNTLTVNNTIPKDVKQKDWLLTMFKKYNIYMDVDPTNPKKLVLESRDDGFYTGAYVNWTDKFDPSKGWEINPVGELNFKNLRYTYKPDKDYWNEKYETTYKEVYGSELIEVSNDFNKSDNKTELIISNTVLVGNILNDMVIPAIYKNDNGTIKPMKANIRSIYYGGLITISGSWSLVHAGGTTTYTQVPFAGHVDNPYSPTFDLNWGIPKELYYNFPSPVWTNNNLYNKYYSKFIEEITDPDSKIIKAYFRLTEADIHQFSFRKKVFCQIGDNDAYYVVNKIINYNPLVSDVTQVELLKLKTGTTFVSEIIDITARTGNTSGDDYDIKISDPTFTIEGNSSTSTSRVFGGSNNTAVGEDNTIIGGTGSRVFGSGNSLVNSNNVTVNNDVEDYLGISVPANTEVTTEDNNTTNLRGSFKVTESGASFVKAPFLGYESKTADFTTVAGVPLYFVDATGGNITATLCAPSDGTSQPVEFIRVDTSGNTVTITDGSFSHSLTSSLGKSYLSNGSTWFQRT
jgi:hypothetical protein